MRTLVILFILWTGSFAFGQHEFQVWTKLGTEGDVIKRLDWQFELNSRFGDRGINTFFPQVGFEYKVKKWFRPSLEYRYILDKDRYENYRGGHRININANFKRNPKRWRLRARLRYQYAFDRFTSSENFDADFDQAFRARIRAGYDLKDNIFSPLVGAELFYNPQFGPISPNFSKVRFILGTNFELDGPHDASIRYLLDKRFFDFGADLRHVISFSYSYKIK